MRNTGLVPRRLEEVAISRMAEAPVILLQGPRTVGKSTLLRVLSGRLGGRVIDLDDPTTRDAVRDDPGLFVSGQSTVFIDEYQHVPFLLDSIKAELNRDGSPGRFVLAGSTRFDALPVASQSLTGRLHRVEILPLSQGEIRGGQESLLESLFDDPEGTVSSDISFTTRAGYAELIAKGGLPLALVRAEAARARWFDDYIALSLERDLQEVGRVRQPSALEPLLRRLASQTASLLNISRAGAAADLATSTASDYLRLFERAFLVRRLPAWGKTLRSSVVRSPKLHMLDSGIAARLLRLPPDKLASPDPTAMQQFGHLLETFVVGEVFKQASWMEHRPFVGHWRTHDGSKVDIVVEDGRDGSVVGIEVKAGTRIYPRERKGLRILRDALGDRFKAGVVLYTGAHCIRYSGKEAGIIALPVDRLWCHGYTNLSPTR
ncbi:MAG: ATP-binding protein [Acidimicrobiia bacterium]|nr:ATP-binding protein [Acidimicrobiia bacterium]